MRDFVGDASATHVASHLEAMFTRCLEHTLDTLLGPFESQAHMRLPIRSRYETHSFGDNPVFLTRVRSLAARSNSYDRETHAGAAADAYIRNAMFM